MPARITDKTFDEAVKARYLDLRDGLKNDVQTMDLYIEPDNKELRVMRMLAAIAKLQAINLKD